MIEIPTNYYAEPTTIREEVAEKIAMAMISGDTFNSQSWNKVFRSTYVSNNKNGYNRFVFHNTYYGTPNDATRIRTCEVERAFDIILHHGWFIYRYSDRNGTEYRVRKSGSIQDRWLGCVVTKFTENIDH